MINSRPKKIIKYVLPTILSSVSFFLFTIVDGIFVGQSVGTNGLGAINLVAPFLLVIGAVSMMINIGGVTMFAIRIGKGDIDGANKVFRHGLIVLGTVIVVLSALGTFGADTICTLLGANETFHDLAADYLFWYSIFIIPAGLSMALQNYCRNDGAPGLVGAAVIISTIINIFGDWLLMFPLDMGIKGAAIATGISQTIGLLIMLIHFIRKNGILRFGKVKLDKKLLREIFLRGLPEGLGQLTTPIMTLCMNFVLIQKIGDIGINAFSIVTYVASFTTAVFYGCSEGLQPLFGQSYGAKNGKDMRFYFKAGMLINFIGSIAVLALVLAVSRPICILFGSNPETLEYIVQIMPLYSWGFVIMALNVMISAYLYSTERSGYAIIINFLRSLVVNVAVIMILPMIFGANIVWFTFGIYEAIMLVISAWLLIRAERKSILNAT